MDKPTPLEDRIALIRGAFGQIANGIGGALAQGREPTKEECTAVLEGVLTVANAAIVALTELSYSVGILAEQGERGFIAAVEDAAELRADEINKSKTTRNFIGQPPK